MILLRRTIEGRPQHVALFGIGLIGSAVLRALERDGASAVFRCPVAWSRPAERSRDLAAIAERIEGALGHAGGDLQVIWSAGRCGFDAGEAEARDEQQGFDEAVTILADLARNRPAASVGFLLVSSAGGLFEGQRRVDRNSAPTPRRPYGRLKLHQEAWIRRDDAPWRADVVRPSSVVGPPGVGHRQGLVTTLLRNGLRGVPSRIVGRMETLRDFVPVEDVGSFVAARTRRPVREEGEVATLASARPSSLAQIQHTVESALGHKIYVSYALAPSNEVDITFSPSLLPPGWSPGDLAASVRRIHQTLLAGAA